jgi:PAS domain-containing protein
MKKNNNLPEASLLRKRAEKKLSKSSTRYALPQNEGDTLRLIHELEVHQVELEMQNEELKRTIDNAEAIAKKYSLLYDFAPNGYFTLENAGFISEVNLNGARILGKERDELLGVNFINFVSHDTRDVFSEFFSKIYDTDSKQKCEVN